MRVCEREIIVCVDNAPHILLFIWIECTLINIAVNRPNRLIWTVYLVI